MNTQDSEARFIGMMKTLLMRGHESYKNYINNERIFLYAKIIKINNEATQKLILANCHLLPAEQQKDLILLACHLDVWACQWDDLYDKTSPKLTDTFIFDSAVTFPKEPVSRLSAYFDSKANK